MKKGFVILVTAVLLLSLAGTVSAQDITYSSGFQVANLSSTNDASITITYYPQTGTSVDVSDTVPAGGSVTYASIHDAAGESFNGSVVVSSDQPVVAIANTLGDYPDYAAATGGFNEGSKSFSLPLVMCNNNGFDTWFNVQNAGSETAEVTINYTPGLEGSADSTTVNIDAGKAMTFKQAAGSDGTDPKCGDGLGTKFVGGASITSNQPVVATVMQLNTSSFPVLMGYNGFTGGGEDIRAPLVMANNGGFYTGIQVQNAGTTTTTVTVDFSANTIEGGNDPADLEFDLGPGASATYIQNGDDGTNDWGTVGQYVGAATITSDNGEPLVAIVNQTLPGSPANGTAYEAFTAADATTNINVPLVMANNSGFYTGIQVQNASTTDACEVTIDFADNTAGGTFEPSNLVFDLDAGESATYIQNGNDGTNNWTDTYVGAANVTAGCNIVAIVNEINPTLTGDQFYTFDAFNYE